MALSNCIAGFPCDNYNFLHLKFLSRPKNGDIKIIKKKQWFREEIEKKLN